MAVSAEVSSPISARINRKIDIWILIGILAVYAAANLVAWSTREPVFTWDSGRYTSGDIFLFLNPGITPTLLFSSFNDPAVGTLIHTVVYIAAWSSLAAAVTASLRSTWVKWPLLVMLLVLSLTTPLWSWNLVVGSEGLTVSALVLWMSTLVWLAASTRWSTFALSIITTSALLITRPQTLILVIPIQMVGTIWWIRREKKDVRSHVGLLAALTVVLLASTGWATYRVALLANDDVYSFRYALHNLVEKTPSFREYVLQEAPPCEAIPAALNGPQPWTDVIAFDQTLINTCPETFVWFKSDAVSIQNWVLYDPDAAVLNFRDVMWGIALPVGAEHSVVPEVIDNALLPVHNVWLASGMGLIVGLALGFIGRVRFRITALGVVGAAVAIGSVTAYLFAVWAADGYDVIRHMVPITPLLPVAALVLPSALTGKRSAC